MTLGARVRYYREGLSLRLEDLSVISRVDVGTISALEMRNSRKSMYAGQLAAALGLTLDELLDEDTDHLPRLKSREQSKLGAVHLVTAAPAAVREPDPPWSWPFTQVTPAMWRSLNDIQRAQVDAFTLGLVASSGKPRSANGQ